MNDTGTPPPTVFPPSSEVLESALLWLGDGRKVALATVIATWGSSPRPPGSQLAVNEDGAFVGSVSGGCVEAAVIDAADRVMESGEPETLDFGVADEEAWAVGLACGGSVRVRVDAVPGDGALLGALLDAVRADVTAVVATDLDGGTRALILPLTEEVVDPPDGAAASLVPGPELLRAARAAALADESRTVEIDGRDVFVRVYNPRLRMVVVGAVHIAQPLAAMATGAGFRVTVIDPRSAFATESRFPGVTLDRRWPEEAFAALEIDHRTAVVTLTHDPRFDDPALVAALASPAFYVGALGSRRTHGRRLERLAERGIAEEELQRIDGPVGLDIGARTPGEIAVAILGAVVAALRGAVA